MTIRETRGPITQFVEHHYRHFNAATLKDAARAYKAHIDSGKKMMLTLAGAMSTAELGLSLAAMIREDKVHAITCTGANLEEDLYNLVAHDHYERVPHYRYLSAADEQALLERKLNRVTDTCIPEEEAMRRVESSLLALWQAAGTQGESRFPISISISCCAKAHSPSTIRSTRRTPGCSPRPKRICRCSSPAGRTRPPATCSPHFRCRARSSVRR
jgi:deoxyhypusine synthase